LYQKEQMKRTRMSEEKRKEQRRMTRKTRMTKTMMMKRPKNPKWKMKTKRGFARRGCEDRLGEE
jgi:hypothetical protein